MIESLRTFLHSILDVRGLIQWGGYFGLLAIVFAETGLLIGFFLPGDSLLVTAGIFASKGDLNLWTLLAGLSIAAIVGDAVGYAIGKKAGETLYSRPDSRFFKRKHLIAAHDFYEKYGGKTIILARFVPIIRTFAPTVAGAAGMTYRRFALFNVIGGVGWVFSTVLGGYFLGRTIPDLDKNIHFVIAIVVGLSILPIVYEAWKARRAARAGSAAA
ncbi:MAG: VTT domain-containing protein [Thermoanaerobaculia bacterium]